VRGLAKVIGQGQKIRTIAIWKIEPPLSRQQRAEVTNILSKETDFKRILEGDFNWDEEVCDNSLQYDPRLDRT
jgi:hypothetical protein